MQVWTAVHLLAVFVAFALTAGVGIVLRGVAQTGDVRAIRIAAKAARPLFMVGGITLVLGIIFGFGAAGALGVSLSARWLIASYALVALLLILGFAILMPWGRRLGVAAASSPDDSPSSELLRVAHDKLARAAGPIMGLVWLAFSGDHGPEAVDAVPSFAREN